MQLVHRDQPKKYLQAPPSSSSSSEVPVVHLEVAEARLQAGQSWRGVQLLAVADGRDRQQQLRQRFAWPSLNLGREGGEEEKKKSQDEFLQFWKTIEAEQVGGQLLNAGNPWSKMEEEKVPSSLTCLKKGWPMSADAEGLKERVEDEQDTVFIAAESGHVICGGSEVVPLLWVPLQTQTNEGVEVWWEGAVVWVSHWRGRGLAIGVASSTSSTTRTFADARICARAGRLEWQLLRRNGAGVQQARHRPVQLL